MTRRETERDGERFFRCAFELCYTTIPTQRRERPEWRRLVFRFYGTNENGNDINKKNDDDNQNNNNHKSNDNCSTNKNNNNNDNNKNTITVIM